MTYEHYLTQPDESLKQFATDREWEYYLKFCELGSQRLAADALGMSRSSLVSAMEKLKRRAGGKFVPPTDPKYVLKGQSILLKGGIETARWDKTKLEGRADEDVPHIPDPKAITKISTFYDQQGRVTAQWIGEKPELLARAKMWEDFANVLARDRIPALPPVDTPLGLSHQDLLAVYPIGDHHTGMLAWARETGQPWDLKIAESMLQKASRKLIRACPPCEQALIAILGDFFHTDSYASVTPAHKHLLDSDIRYPKMMEIGLVMLENVITAAAERHQDLFVIFEKGNHDESTMAAVAVFFKRLYRDNPRVKIDDSPSFFHIHVFGKNLLATNHGDKVKMEKQLGILAHDHPVEWGLTKYRLVMTGHVHTEHRREFPGGWVESFGVLPPADAYAHRGGWRSVQQMHALVFHREHGLVERHIVNPGMLS